MSEQPTLFPVEPRSARIRRPREVIEAEKHDKEIRRQRRDLKHQEYEARRTARTKKREIRERLDAKAPIVVERTPEPFVPYRGCRACCTGPREIPIKITGADGLPAIDFACSECARFFEVA